MNANTDIRTLQKIKRTHERVSVIAGATMAVTLSIYFFTFSDLLDSGANGLVWFETVSSILFLFGLIYLKRLALFITRRVLNGNDECRRALNGMTPADLDTLPSE